MNLKKILFVFLLALSGAPSNAEPPQETSASEIVSNETIIVSRQAQKSRNATVRVVTAFGHGSGTYIKVGKSYGIITAAHVVEGSNLVIIENSGRQHLAVPVWMNQEDDVAFLWLPTEISEKKALKLKVDSKTKAGDEIMYSGFPSFHEMLTFRCNVSNADTNQIVVQGFAWFGASGSGFINKKGEVFAVLSAVTVENFYGHPQVVSTLVLANKITQSHIRDIEFVLEAMQKSIEAD